MLLAGLALSRDVFKARSIQKFDGLKNVEQDAERVLQVPRAANLEAVDSLMGDDICFQVTCSQTHKVTAKGLIAAFKRCSLLNIWYSAWASSTLRAYLYRKASGIRLQS